MERRTRISGQFCSGYEGKMRMKKKSRFVPWKLGLAVCALTLILGTGGVSISAAQSAALTPELETTIVPKPTITPKPTAKPKPTPKPVKKGLVKEGRVYRYYVKNKRVTSTWKTVNGKHYWFKSNTVAAHDGPYKVRGVFYVFNEKAQRVEPGKTAVVTVNKVKYLVNARGRALTGWRELNGKMYYADKRGKCAAGTTVEGIKFNKNGYATNMTQVQCKFAARSFITQHSNAGASNYEKFRSCFRYIMAYTNFVGYMDPTPQEFKTKNWVYKYALQMFRTGLTGNCYGIASCVAAIAKELGYQPYVITIPDGHSFVMINGLYYDNMYGTLFGAASRPAYTVEHRIKF